MKLDIRIYNIIRQYKTPCYIFEESELKNQTEKIRGLSKNKHSICFAVKANPFIVSMIDKYVDRFEVCSPGEYRIVKENNISTKKIVYSGVNKTFAEIQALFDEEFDGICTIESNNQWKYINALILAKRKKTDIIVRLSSGNQFGVSESELFNIIKESQHNPFCNFLGIHYFSGTQKKNLNEIKSEIKNIAECCNKIYIELGVKVSEIEYGPGLYSEYFSEIDDSEYLSEIFECITSELSDYEITIETGRYLSYTCGKYYTSVVDIKNTGKNNYAIVDGGIHQINYFGQLLGIKNPIVKHYSNSTEANEKEFVVCGSLCSANDILLKKWQGSLNISDIFEFQRAGAYSSTESISLFLSRDLPAIIELTESGVKMLRDHQSIHCLNK